MVDRLFIIKLWTRNGQKEIRKKNWACFTECMWAHQEISVQNSENYIIYDDMIILQQKLDVVQRYEAPFVK